MAGEQETANLPMPGCAWAEPVEALASALGSSAADGLGAAEAARRLTAEGPNELRSDPGPNPLKLFLSQFKSVVIWVLAAAAFVSAALGQGADAAAIGAIVILNALIGFYQEFRAEKAVAALRKMAAPQARVIRDGHVLVLPAAEVVRGDLLVLEAGDLVAADARLVEAASLRANEAPLTGESEPVGKGVETLPAETPLADRRNMVYLGASVTAGQGRALVVAAGMATEVGRIAGLLETAGAGRTPLQERLDRVGRFLLIAGIAIVTLVFILGVLRGEAPGPMLLASISLAVAAVPEGLPAVVTVALSLGVARMIRRNALVRRLPAVETLGSAQVIGSDKTGTLTLGQMTARVLWAAGREVEITGEGYRPRGEFREQGRRIEPGADPLLREALTIAAACNEAELQAVKSEERGAKSEQNADAGIVGDPTEGALLAAAAKAGIERAAIERDWPRVRVLPFDSDRKRMTVVRQRDGCSVAFVKGAPDVVVPRCAARVGDAGGIESLTQEDRQQIRAANEALANRALRVMALAYRELPSPSVEEVEADLVFAGLIAMYDPPRPEAIEAVAQSQAAGIRVVMITGDHPATAAAIARELGILREGDEAAAGKEIQRLSDAELRERAAHIAVYARVTAEDKLRIVRALKARGLVVAMTGDGVNDAPAMREAAIGVAMGITGAEVTKEASDMVIMDDNFASIVAAVEEGRGIYDNIKKCLQYLLAGNTAEILVMFVAVLANWPLPLLPLQLLWVNLVTDGLPALALATDPVDPDALRRPPRPADEQLADRPFIGLMLFTGALTAGVSLLAFYYGFAVQGNVALARSYAFTTLVFAELLRSLGVRSATRPFWQRGGGVNRLLLGVVAGSISLQILMHHVPFFERLFDTGPVPDEAKAWLLVLGAVPLLVLEARKLFAAGRAAPDGPTQGASGHAP